MLDRFTEIGTLSQGARTLLSRRFALVVIPLVIEMGVLYLKQSPGFAAFSLISLSSCAALWGWHGRTRGLPLLPVMVLQALLIYGLPIVASNKSLVPYSPEMITQAGAEVATFNLALIVSWLVGMQMFMPSRPVSLALQGLASGGFERLTRTGFMLAAASTVFSACDALGLTGGLYAALPAGTSSILASLSSVAGASGFFLVSVNAANPRMAPMTRAAFWLLLIANTGASATGFLLSSAAISLLTVAIGLFWGSGRVPWRYLTLVILILSFLNMGKATMRGRYWTTESEPVNPIHLSDIPSVYAQWAQTSYEAMLQNSEADVESGPKLGPQKRNQTLLERIDNLQNLLFVIDAEEHEHIEPLHGATYTLIPPLLIPRVFWPEKPRSHEGQVMLNVHFGRQDLNSTFDTYIAWGLIPEAYGNFGPYLGSALLAAVCGLLFAWIENVTARRLLVSMEGFLSLTLIIALMNSFEMVASVLVTSVFQAFIVVVAASAPFVSRVVAPRPDEPAA